MRIMRVIDPEHAKPQECFIKNLLPGDVCLVRGIHYLVTSSIDEDGFICLVSLMYGKLEYFVDNTKALPVYMEAVIR